jgi:hypothetical protein
MINICIHLLCYLMFKCHVFSCLNVICVCSEKTAALSVLPKVKEVGAWDGKDAAEELISAEEYSLDDLMSD